MSDQKYLADGRIVRVLAALSNGHFVVEIGHDFDQGDPEAELFFQDTEVVTAVFDKPPRDAIDKDVAGLQQRAAHLRASIHDLQSVSREVERAHKERLTYLSQFAGLERVEQFMRGEITHYVFLHHYSDRVEILDFDKARTDDKWNPELRMLQLFGDPRQRNLKWCLSRYSGGDGTSDSSICYPCTSETEAHAKAQELLDATVAEHLGKGPDYAYSNVIDSAKKYGLKIADEYVQRVKNSEARSLAQSIARAEKELADLKAKQAAA